MLWQVLFLLYHYFEAREMYNAIRIFIAGYVWMTGYNNFSYYYKYKDYSIARQACRFLTAAALHPSLPNCLNGLFCCAGSAR